MLQNGDEFLREVRVAFLPQLLPVLRRVPGTGARTGEAVHTDAAKLYAGDTGLFGDMRLIGETADIDVAILPIGDHFTMGLDDAVRATDFLRPKAVVPTHYSAFEPIQEDPDKFASRVEALGVTCRILAPGEEADF